MSSINVGLVQAACHPGHVEDNRERLVRAAKEAFAAKADIVILPELAIGGYVTDDQIDAGVFAEPIPGYTTDTWTELCKTYDGWICGGIAEEDHDLLYDSAVLVGPEGIVLKYRKAHLFAKEKNVFQAGDVGFPMANLPFGNVGILICYDLRFPEAVRILSLQDVELICVPAAWVAGFDSTTFAEGMPWQCATARVLANLNQVFIAASSQVGTHAEMRFLGSSMIADPMGGVTVGPLSGSQEEVVIHEIDIADARRAQHRSGLIRPRIDRRTDLYAIRYENDEI